MTTLSNLISKAGAKIVSNIPLPMAELIEVDLPKKGEPLKLIKTLLKSLATENRTVILAFVFVGRRLITNENTNLLSGRSHRLYYGICRNGKIAIKYSRHKIKHLNLVEEQFVAEQWHPLFFLNEGRYLIEKSSGTIFIEQLIYKLI